MVDRDPTHDLIAQVIMRLGKDYGIDPVHIRCALAINLVNVCRACGDGAKALTDVQHALDVSEARNPPS